MSFFEKLKQGVSEAGQKAKTTVEVNRLKLQIQARQNTIKEKCCLIGSIVFNAYEKNEPLCTNPEIEQICAEIAQIQAEIKQVESRIKELNGEKDCVCGQVVRLDARFCPSCGHRFEEEKLASPILIEQTSAHSDSGSQSASELPLQTRVCPSCHEKIQESDKFCGSCGKELSCTMGIA